jgi:hypothetical protein
MMTALRDRCEVSSCQYGVVGLCLEKVALHRRQVHWHTPILLLECPLLLTQPYLVYDVDRIKATLSYLPYEQPFGKSPVAVHPRA